jgi:hypothetical protein
MVDILVVDHLEKTPTENEIRFTVSIDPSLGSSRGAFKPAFLPFAGAKMNARNDIFPFAWRLPWVRFVIFVVHQTLLSSVFWRQN